MAAVCHHLDRSRETLNADPEKKIENRLMAGVLCQHAPELINSRIADIEKKSGKKTRKDAVAAIEVLMTASPEFFKDKQEWQVQVWAERSTDWAKNHFGQDNIVSAMLHRDESTPHLHIMVFPETPDHRLSAKEWLDGGDKMRDMQDRYAQAVKIDGLERGVKGSKARHLDIKRWYAEGLPLAREQVRQLTDQALALGADIEKALSKQFNDITRYFQPKEKVQEHTIERQPERRREIKKEKEKDQSNDREFGL